jgi:hypothetical protein
MIRAARATVAATLLPAAPGPERAHRSPATSKSELIT